MKRRRKSARQGSSYAKISGDFSSSPVFAELSDKEVRLLVRLASWCAMWDYAGAFSEKVFFGLFANISQKKRRAILADWLRPRSYREALVLLEPNGDLRLNPVFIPFGRDGTEWDRTETPTVLKRDGNRCRYCGRNLERSEVTFDHVFPRSRGGSDKPRNLVVACWPCNSKKNDRTPEEAGMVLR